MTSNLTRMDPRHHAAVRSLLTGIAGENPLEATGPASPDRRPAWRRPAVRRTGLGLAGVAAVVVTSLALLVGDPTAPAGYASWTAVPASATSPRSAAQTPDDDIDQQASRCSDLTGTGVGIQGVPARPEEASRRSILVDRRGDWTFCVDVTKGSGTAQDPLIVLYGLKGGDTQGGGATVWDQPFTWPQTTKVRVLGGSPYAVAPQDPATENYSLVGALGPEVTGVDINLADGTTVTTTVHEDFWAAWWPGRVSTARVDTLTVHTTGTSYQVDPRTLQLPWDRTGTWP